MSETCTVSLQILNSADQLLFFASVVICRWYFPDTKRLDAEKLLSAGGNQHGAFLIRDSESQRGELALSGKPSYRLRGGQGVPSVLFV